VLTSTSEEPLPPCLHWTYPFSLTSKVFSGQTVTVICKILWVLFFQNPSLYNKKTNSMHKFIICRFRWSFQSRRHSIEAFFLQSKAIIACLHDQTKVAYLEGRLFSSQSELLETFQIALIGWIKAVPPKKPFLFWSCKQAIKSFQNGKKRLAGKKPG